MLFPKGFEKAQLMLLFLPVVLRQALAISSAYETLKAPRSKRYLVFPPRAKYADTKVQLVIGLGLPMDVEASIIMGYVFKFNYNLPTNASYFTEPYIRYARSANYKDEEIEYSGPDKNLKDDSEVHEPSPITRYDFYDMILTLGGGSWLDKACLLKTICETAAVPFSKDAGLFAELIYIFFTPSTTPERINDPTDREYLAAEILGRAGYPGQCAERFPECSYSILEYFTEIRPR